MIIAFQLQYLMQIQGAIRKTLREQISELICTSEQSVQQLHQLYTKVLDNLQIYIKEVDVILLSDSQQANIKKITISILRYMVTNLIEKHQANMITQNVLTNFYSVINKLQKLIDSCLTNEYKYSIVEIYITIVRLNHYVEVEKAIKKIDYYFQKGNTMAGIFLAKGLLGVLQRKLMYTVFKKLVLYVPAATLKHLQIVQSTSQCNEIVKQGLQLVLECSQQLFVGDKELIDLIESQSMQNILNILIKRLNNGELHNDNLVITSVKFISKSLAQIIKKSKHYLNNSHWRPQIIELYKQYTLATLKATFLSPKASYQDDEQFEQAIELLSCCCYFYRQLLNQHIFDFNTLSGSCQLINQQYFLQNYITIVLEIVSWRICRIAEQQKDSFQQINHYINQGLLGTRQQQIQPQQNIIKFIVALCKNYEDIGQLIKKMSRVILYNQYQKYSHQNNQIQIITCEKQYHIYQKIAYNSRWKNNDLLFPSIFYPFIAEDIQCVDMVTKTLEACLTGKSLGYTIQYFHLCLCYVLYFDDVEQKPYPTANRAKGLSIMKFNPIQIANNHLVGINCALCILRIGELYLKIGQQAISIKENDKNQQLVQNVDQQSYAWKKHSIDIIEYLRNIVFNNGSLPHRILIQIFRILVRYLFKVKQYSSSISFTQPQVSYASTVEQIKMFLSQLYQIYQFSDKDGSRTKILANLQLLYFLDEVVKHEELEVVYEGISSWIMESTCTNIHNNNVSLTIFQPEYEDIVLKIMKTLAKSTMNGSSFLSEEFGIKLVKITVNTISTIVHRPNIQFDPQHQDILYLLALYSTQIQVINFIIMMILQQLIKFHSENPSVQEKTSREPAYNIFILHTIIYYHHSLIWNDSFQAIVSFFMQMRTAPAFFVGKYNLMILMLLNYEMKNCMIQINQPLNTTIINYLFIQESSYEILYDAPIFVVQSLELLQNCISKYQTENIKNSLIQQILHKSHFIMGAIILNLDRIYEHQRYFEYGNQDKLNLVRNFSIFSSDQTKSDREIWQSVIIYLLDHHINKVNEFYPPFLTMDQFQAFREFLGREYHYRESDLIRKWIEGILDNYTTKLYTGSISGLLRIKKIPNNKVLRNQYRTVLKPKKTLDA